MIPESIVTSLKWSKKLKEAGFEQNSQWFWVEDYCDPPVAPFLALNQGEDHDFHQFYWPAEECTISETEDFYAAPTSEEILRKLPVMFPKDTASQSDSRLVTFPSGNSWIVCYESGDHGRLNVPFRGDTLANAAAAMYCYLAESKLLPTEK